MCFNSIKSSHKLAKTMQKRSFPVQIIDAPVRLNPVCPIDGGDPFEQQDRPITFLHRHNCLELGYCFSGSGVFVVGEKVLPFGAGDVTFINHTEVHLARSAPGTSSHWAWIYLDPIRLVGHSTADASTLDPTPWGGPSFCNVLKGANHPHVARVVARMVQELRGRERGYAQALRALTWELMTLMHRLPIPNASAVPRRDFDRLAPALHYLSHRYMERVNVQKLAGLCKLSEAQFRRVFVSTIGRPPRAYWHDLRMRMAASLLRTTARPVLEISQDVGFETLSSFNRVFRATFTTTPRAWRGRTAPAHESQKE